MTFQAFIAVCSSQQLERNKDDRKTKHHFCSKDENHTGKHSCAYCGKEFEGG